MGAFEIAQCIRELVESGVVAESSRNEFDRREEAVPHLLPESRPRPFLRRDPRLLGEITVRPVPAGEPEQHEPGRQQTPVRQVVHGRDQLLAGQVTGDPEHDERARVRQPRQPAVPRIP
jgi:hypothetical protein